MKRKAGKIIKIPIECEFPLRLLNQRKAIKTSTLSKSNQTVLGIIAKRTNALRIERTCVLTGDKVRILNKTPKKLVIQLPN